MEVRASCRRIYGDATEIRGIHTRLGRILNDVNNITGSLDSQSFGIVQMKLNVQIHNLADMNNNIHHMSNVLHNISSQYENTEQAIRNNASISGRKNADWINGITNINNSVINSITDIIKKYFPWMVPIITGGFNYQNIIDWIREHWQENNNSNVRYKVDNIAFDDKGSYGGNQGSAKSITDPARRREIYEQIRKNLPYKMTDKQLDAYLKKMNSEGCGYVAIVNTIFAEYAGRPEEFEKMFGYPMYHNGDLNYDMLIADMYSSYDNMDSKGNYDSFRDYDSDSDGIKSNYNYKNDTTGHGTTASEQARFLRDFMKEHGVNVKTEVTSNITVDNFESISRSGKHVIIDYFDGDVLNMDGTPYQHCGGHAMTVTGVTKDGKFIVSSWGKEFLVDPKQEGCSMTFVTAEY